MRNIGLRYSFNCSFDYRPVSIITTVIRKPEFQNVCNSNQNNHWTEVYVIVNLMGELTEKYVDEVYICEFFQNSALCLFINWWYTILIQDIIKFPKVNDNFTIF